VRSGIESDVMDGLERREARMATGSLRRRLASILTELANGTKYNAQRDSFEADLAS